MTQMIRMKRKKLDKGVDGVSHHRSTTDRSGIGKRGLPPLQEGNRNTLRVGTGFIPRQQEDKHLKNDDQTACGWGINPIPTSGRKYAGTCSPPFGGVGGGSYSVPLRGERC